MKNIIDRKRAASGERDEGDGTVLAPVESLVAALKSPERRQHTQKLIAPSTEAPSGFVERRGAFPKPHTYNPVPVHLRALMLDIPARTAVDANYHLAENRELVAVIGPSDRTDKRQMATDEVHYWDLNQDPMENAHAERVTTKLHPMVYYIDLLRDELLTNTVVFELALYSRVVGQDHKDYIGKTKVYFPRPGNELRLWINLARIK